MTTGLHIDATRTAMRRWPRYLWSDRRLPVTIALVVLGIGMFAAGVGYTLNWREHLHRERTRAFLVRNDLDTLQTLYLSANADFLQGFGSARLASFAWPIARVGKATACFQRLGEAYARTPDSAAILQALREETAQWAYLQAEIAVNARLEDGRASVDSARLLDANRLLERIASQVAGLRDEQTAKLKATADSAARHTEVEGLVLALSGLVACALLGYAFIAHYRAGLARQRAHVVAAESERRFREYFDHHPLPMLIFDVETLEIIAANRAAATQYDYTSGELAGRSMASLYAPADSCAFLSDLRATRSAGTGSGAAGICRHQRRDGALVYVDLSYHFLTYDKREACFITAIDVTQRKNAELELRLRSRALNAIGNGVLITRATEEGQIVEYANPAFERITGYALTGIVGRDCATLCARSTSRDLFPQLQHIVEKGQDASTLLQSRRADGRSFWNQLHVASVSDERGIPSYHISVISDLTELIDSRDKLVMQARRDALTDLPNRVTLHELIGQAIEEQRAFALLFMDLDHFKDVNDSLGHGAGDRLLREVARRLSDCVGSDGIATRYGGDEFVMMLPDPYNAQRLAKLYERLTRAFSAPIHVDDTQLSVQLSIGVACYPEDGNDPETLLKHADLAMYHVKANGRNGVERFNPRLASVSDERIKLSRRLRDALEQKAFELVYQPQIDMRARRVCGVEALIRWRDSELGPVSPSVFIPLAEENGLIEELGEWVLHTACAQAKRWETHLPGMRISVNVAPRQLARDNFCDVVRRALAITGLPAERLELEITEGALVAPNSLQTLRALSDMGVSIAIDDFGTGYSSLSYLRTFHANRLKVDMSFVRGIGVSHADESIIRAVSALAQSLGFEIVAEGVESDEQLRFLLDRGCPIIQGYLFSKPLAAPDIAAYVARFEATESAALT
jgi:diguanylate cyclase (GGDEF)-like protein/PAS domain S-box-containing protein